MYDQYEAAPVHDTEVHTLQAANTYHAPFQEHNTISGELHEPYVVDAVFICQAAVHETNGLETVLHQFQVYQLRQTYEQAAVHAASYIQA